MVLGKLKQSGISNPQTQGVGKITVEADSSIVYLERSTRGFKDIKGYRIQIFMGNMEQVKAERNKYLGLGLPHSAYLKQMVPEYSLQIGDFTTRMEMERNLEAIKKYYPKAFSVVETIEPPKYGKK